jgi:hypothetical protein
MKNSMTRFPALAVLLAALGCGQSRVLLVEKAQLLEKPYPLGYPSSAPLPNRVLADLEDERVCVLQDTYGKDFHVYRVRTGDGRKGYVMDSPSVREANEACQ